MSLHRPRARTLKELAEQLVPYFRAEIAYDPEASAKFLKDPDSPRSPGVPAGPLRRAARTSPRRALEAALRAVAEEKGIKAGVLIHPTRMALSGAAGGPPLFDLVETGGPRGRP